MEKKRDLSKLFVLIPSYEPDEKLIALLEALKDTGFGGILVVDDGSGAAYADIFRRCAQIPGVRCAGYETNHGKGHALKYGLGLLLEAGCAGVITADSDGQHTPTDIRRMGEALLDTPDQLILGARNCLEEQVPLRSKLGNRFTRWLFRVATGISVRDTQTGLRAMSAAAMRSFSETPGDRFEYEMNMLGDCRKYHIKMREIPIETVYIENNRSTHFRTVRDSLRVGAVFLKFLSTSGLSTVTDYLLFLLFLFLLGEKMPADRTFSTLLQSPALLGAFFGARVLSATLNFFLNKRVVFRQKGHTGRSIAAYAALAVAVAVLTYALLTLLVTLHVPAFLAQPIASLVLFCLSYQIQRRVIFK